MKKLIFALALASCLCCCNREKGDWTASEKKIIYSSDALSTKGSLEVYTVNNKAQEKVLRASCNWLSAQDLCTKEYSRLCERMIATVTSPEQDGVGIAGPQVGISRRIVAVQRLDKEGEPFEVYPNITIEATRGQKVSGPEGCLSVPGYRGEVARYRDIDIKYTSTATLCDTVERITGFTAVIFQHEIDHLVGIIYTDKADNVVVRE